MAPYTLVSSGPPRVFITLVIREKLTVASAVPDAHKQQPILLLGQRNGFVTPYLPRHGVGRVCAHIGAPALAGPVLQDKSLGLFLRAASLAAQPSLKRLAYPLYLPVCSSKIPCHHEVAVCVCQNRIGAWLWFLLEEREV